MTTRQMAVDIQVPSILSCKLLAVTRETKLTLSIALNPKSKLTLECDSNLTNTKACLSIHYRHPQQGEMLVTKLNVVSEARSGVRGCGE